MEAPARVDPEALTRLWRQGGRPLVEHVVASFVERAPLRLAEARHAAGAADLETAGRLVHNLKTTCLMVGAEAMASRCRQAEVLADGGDIDGFDREVDALLADHAALAPDVARLGAGPPDGVTPRGGAS